MQTSTGWLDKWTVVNETTENGEDGRYIEVYFQVAQRSNVSMAVAAISGERARLTVGLAGVQPPALDAVSADINPPWSAKKRGGFFFTARMIYTDDLVRDLASVTYAQSVDIGIDAVQDELDVDDDRQAALSFVRGEDAHAG